ncbi:hypothetical protein M409DRAFT_52159 [Zasmidium cellare ATCC 36951]|uniref:Uncharacterized protein n=1 Tax=Zasmidium cellare ATCC 36951 TaxID=1080233 RepID=A0A6A6CV03_ZASCE|nr:uncharacterized protein M409DRAFT_52159 [Zasmidium cellare ATCC 36951]KAF2169639.1 hypothetical protein M409DRAFT_52159 [Zasmidium cellare ATCC 36951]
MPHFPQLPRRSGSGNEANPPQQPNGQNNGLSGANGTNQPRQTNRQTNGTNQPRQLNGQTNGTNLPQQPNGHTNGTNPPQQPNGQADSTRRDRAANALAQIRVESQPSITPAEQYGLLQNAQNFLGALETVSMLDLFIGRMESHSRRQFTTQELFQDVVGHLGELNRRDLVNRVEMFMPADWRAVPGTGRAGQRIVLVNVPPDGWFVFGEFPPPPAEDIVDSD